MADLCSPPELDGALEGGEPGDGSARVARHKKSPPVGVVNDEHRNITVAEDEHLWRLSEHPAFALGKEHLRHADRTHSMEAEWGGRQWELLQPTTPQETGLATNNHTKVSAPRR